MQLRVEWQVLTQAIISAIIDNGLVIRLELNNRHNKRYHQDCIPDESRCTYPPQKKGNMYVIYKKLYLVRHFLSRGIVKIVGDYVQLVRGITTASWVLSAPASFS